MDIHSECQDVGLVGLTLLRWAAHLPLEGTVNANQIAADLRKKITDGEYAYGSRMPSVRDIATEYDVSQQTAAAAYASLEATGMVRVGRGVQGTVVTAGPAADAHLGHFSPPDLTAAEAWRPANGGEGSKEIISVRQTPATPLMLEWGIQEGTDVVERVLVRRVDGTPVQHKVTVVPLDVASKRPQGYDGIPPMLVPVGAPAATPPHGVRMADWLGWDVAHTEWAITVEPMTAEAAAVLGLTEGVPAFRILAVAKSSTGDTTFVTATTVPLHHRITLDIVGD